MQEMPSDGKSVVYQLFVRLFGNKKIPTVLNGTLEENGSGKFDDINDAALLSLQQMGITHIWYTGIIEHATMTDFTHYGIQPDDWRLVKGRAGSPFAIKDYFDVSPELAVNVEDRLKEFENLIERTHRHGLKVIIDFIPNHVARSYHSESDDGMRNFFGAFDDTGKMFDPQNNFYYLQNEKFIPPADYQPLGVEYPDHMISHIEIPARVTGNNVLSSTPGTDDWFETVKLNFGIDIFNNQESHFHPVPRTWIFLREVLLFWTNKGVDGFRCDMAEMVPAEFWKWLIPQVKEVKDIIFIAEIYDNHLYHKYIYDGGFDYLYDKAGLYDKLVSVLKEESPAWQISDVLRPDISNHLLNFMENHDEVRLSSQFLCRNPWSALPAVVVSAAVSSGPFMVYNGQETGESSMERAGFGGGNGRTTIYDYWNLPELQKWVNNGLFDGGQLNASQLHLRKTYSTILNTVRNNSLFSDGLLYVLKEEITSNEITSIADHIYCFLRYRNGKMMLIAVNFSRDQYIPVSIQFDKCHWESLEMNPDADYLITDLISGSKQELLHSNENHAWQKPLNIVIPLSGAMMFEFSLLEN
ncbi:MAG: alpha-amylase family glycosyl hydrolase [Bacteroidota bacterium]